MANREPLVDDTTTREDDFMADFIRSIVDRGDKFSGGTWETATEYAREWRDEMAIEEACDWMDLGVWDADTAAMAMRAGVEPAEFAGIGAGYWVDEFCLGWIGIDELRLRAKATGG